MSNWEQELKLIKNQRKGTSMNSTLLRFNEFLDTNVEMKFLKGKGKKLSETTVTIKHKANSPATPDEIDVLVNLYPNISPVFLDFYRQMNGSELFVCRNQNIEDDVSLSLFSINFFQTEKDILWEWLEPYYEDIDDWEELHELGAVHIH